MNFGNTNQVGVHLSVRNSLSLSHSRNFTLPFQPVVREINFRWFQTLPFPNQVWFKLAFHLHPCLHLSQNLFLLKSELPVSDGIINSVILFTQTLRDGLGSNGRERDHALVTVIQRLQEPVACGCMGAWKVYSPRTICGDGALVCLLNYHNVLKFGFTWELATKEKESQKEIQPNQV